MSGSAECRNHPPRGKRAQQSILIRRTPRSPERVRETRAFLLTKTYMDAGNSSTSVKIELRNHSAGFGRRLAPKGPEPEKNRDFSCRYQGDEDVFRPLVAICPVKRPVRLSVPLGVIIRIGPSVHRGFVGRVE